MEAHRMGSPSGSFTFATGSVPMSIAHTLLRGASVFLLPAALLSAIPGTGSAQDISQEWASPAHVSVELARPFIDFGFGGDDGLSALSGYGSVAGVLGSGRTRFIFDVPFARGSLDFGDGSASSSMIGSPFVGVAWAPTDPHRGVSGSIGARVPVPESFEFGDDDFAVGLGLLGDPDRLEAFLTETATLSGTGRAETPLNDDVFVRGQLDADLLVYTGDIGSDGDRTEVFVGWGGLIGWDGEAAFASAQVTGRAILTGDGDDRVFHTLQGQAGLARGAVQPWIGLRVPVQGAFVEDLDWVLRLGLRWVPGA
jgi:hypothetical protein